MFSVIPEPFMSFPNLLCHCRTFYVIPAEAGIHLRCHCEERSGEAISYYLKPCHDR